MRYPSLKIAVILASASLLPAAVSRADNVILKSGDTFTGTVTRVDAQNVDVTTTFAGVIHVKRETIKSIRSDARVTIVAADGTEHTAFVGPTADGNAWRESSAVVPVVVAAPPPPPAPAAPAKVYNTDLEAYFLPVGPHWKNQFTLGVVNTTGNTESTSFASELAFNYANKPSELNLKLGGVYSVNDGQQTAGQFYFDGIYRRILPEWDKSERWYLYGENHELYDGIKGISYRITNSVGLGYYAIREENFKLDLRAGPAYVCEKFFNGDTDSSMSALAGLRAVYTFNERTSLSEEIIYTTSLQDMRIYQLTSETALNVKMPEIARGVGLKLGFRDDYDNVSAGKRNDTRLTLAMTLDF